MTVNWSLTRSYDQRRL